MRDDLLATIAYFKDLAETRSLVAKANKATAARLRAEVGGRDARIAALEEALREARDDVNARSDLEDGTFDFSLLNRIDALLSGPGRAEGGE
jgi:multidrug resistance efflux pump